MIRRELKVRTLFNLLGPLVNPAGARHQVMGVYAPRWVPVVGEVLAALGAEHALVVHGEGLDEISVTGTTLVAEVRDGVVTRVRAHARGARAARASGRGAEGRDAGRERPHRPRRAGRSAGQARATRCWPTRRRRSTWAARSSRWSTACGVPRRRSTPATRRAILGRLVLDEQGGASVSFLADILERKREEVASRRAVVSLEALRARALDAPAPRGFGARLSPRGGPVRVIAEVKRASPSVGTIRDGRGCGGAGAALRRGRRSGHLGADRWSGLRRLARRPARGPRRGLGCRCSARTSWWTPTRCSRPGPRAQTRCC